MKKNILISLSLAILLFMGYGCSSQSKLAKHVDNTRMVAAVQSRDYEIEISRAIPSSGRNIDLNYRYSLAIKGDSVFSYLPYFGRAYSLPYGGGEGLNFDAQLSDYSVDLNKRGEAEVRFTARTFEDTYQYIISVYPDGGASVRVQPNRKQSISFDGRLAGFDAY